MTTTPTRVINERILIPVDPRGEILRRQQQHIDTIGWAVSMVLPDTGGAPFAYTVGLTAHGYPELAVAGLPPTVSHTLLNDLAGRVYDRAERFTHGQHIDNLIAGHHAVIVDGAATDAIHPGTAYALYGTTRVTVQQIVWPDPHGRFPWDPGYSYPAHIQPIIGHP